MKESFSLSRERLHGQKQNRKLLKSETNEYFLHHLQLRVG